MSKQASPKNRTKSRSSNNSSSNSSKSAFQNEWLQAIVLLVLSCILYAQTLSFEYVLDDRMVMTENSIVQQGFTGIPTLLTKDSFAGYDETHGRTDTRRTYRPIPFITFALEKQFFGNNARVSHALNVIFYAATVVVVFSLLRRLLPGSTYPRTLPMITALLFMVHPIHTEVVANVKSRDEILALLSAAASLLLLWKYLQSKQMWHYAASIVLFALALLSKESMLPFVVVIPLALYFFSEERGAAFDKLALMRLSVPFFVLAVVYALVWFGLVGRVEERLYTSVLGNPFAEASIGERLATASAVMSLYLAKVFYPTTLSIGYSYNQIPLQTWGSWQAWLGMMLILSSLGASFWLFPKRHILSFCILFFACALAVTSNFFVYAGGLLSERFLFTPSLAVMLGIAWLLVWANERFFNNALVLWGAVGVVLVLYAAQMLPASAAWRSDYTLLRANVIAAPRSFNMQQGYAKELLRRVPFEMNPILRNAALDSSRIHLRNALEIYPKGEAETFSALASYFDLAQSYDSAAFYAEKALAMSPATRTYRKNLGVIHSNKGVDFAQAGNFRAAVECFKKAYLLDSANAILCGNIGGAYASMQERDSAIVFLQKAVTLDPMLPSARQNLERLRAQVPR